MIVRIWRTHIDQARAGEYLDFAQSKSLPMFRAQPGFAGMLFAAHEAERAVLTLWDDLAAVEALNTSHAYTDTVEAIEATGVVRGPSTVEVLELEGGFLRDGLMSNALPAARLRAPGCSRAS
jgi:heme-degrading monooxygenase HmoA